MPEGDDPQRVVEAGYDAIADRFAAWQREITGSTRLERVEELLELLRKGPRCSSSGSARACARPACLPGGVG